MELYLWVAIALNCLALPSFVSNCTKQHPRIVDTRSMGEDVCILWFTSMLFVWQIFLLNSF